MRLGLSVGNRGQVLDWLADATRRTSPSAGARPTTSASTRGRFAPTSSCSSAPPTIRSPAAHPVAPAELGGRTWLLREPDSGTRSANEEFLSANALHGETLTVGSNGAIRQAARIGLGISFLSADAVTSDVDAGLLGVIAIDPAPPPRAWHVMRARRRPRATAGRRLRRLRQRVGALSSRGGHRRLAEADGAVVGRQALGHEHAQAGVAQQRRRELEQQAVLPHAAGEHDGVQAARAGGLGARPCRRARDRAMEARPDQRRVDAGGHLAARRRRPSRARRARRAATSSG